MHYTHTRTTTKKRNLPNTSTNQQLWTQILPKKMQTVDQGYAMNKQLREWTMKTTNAIDQEHAMNKKMGVMKNMQLSKARPWTQIITTQCAHHRTAKSHCYVCAHAKKPKHSLRIRTKCIQQMQRTHVLERGKLYNWKIKARLVCWHSSMFASGLNTAALVHLHSMQLSCGKGWTPQGWTRLHGCFGLLAFYAVRLDASGLNTAAWLLWFAGILCSCPVAK